MAGDAPIGADRTKVGREGNLAMKSVVLTGASTGIAKRLCLVPRA
jgi:hypothetical protein